MRQLGLDLSGQHDPVVDFSGRRRVELTVRLRAHAATLELSAESGRRACVRWQFAGEPTLAVEGHLRSLWWMVDAATWMSPRRTSDVLDSIVDWVWRESHGFHAGDRERDERELVRRCPPFLHERLRAIQRALLARCEQTAREAACLLRPSLRFDAYRLFVSDPTGRTAQLASTMPGLILWMLLLRNLGLDAVVDEGIRRIAAGEKPRKVLDALLVASGELFDEELRDRRILVERSGPWTDPADLLMPVFPPVLEDVPRSRLANASWYRALRRIFSGAAANTSLIAAFVARNARELAEISTGTGLDPWLGSAKEKLPRLGERLAALARLRGRPLSRDAGAWKTVEAALAAVDATSFIECDPSTRFPEPPYASRTGEDVAIVPLRDAGSLIDESVAMRHCVAQLTTSVLAGGHAVYHAEVRGEPLTVHLAELDGVWSLVEIAGFANRRPSRAGYREVLRWLADNLEEAS